MAIRVGVRLHEYDEMTPHELNIHVEEFYAAKEADVKEQRYQAYMTAKLPLYKKFPPTFEEAFGYDKQELKEQPKKQQTESAMFAEMMKIHKALGGTVY